MFAEIYLLFANVLASLIPSIDASSCLSVCLSICLSNWPTVYLVFSRLFLGVCVLYRVVCFTKYLLSLCFCLCLSVCFYLSLLPLYDCLSAVVLIHFIVAYLTYCCLRSIQQWRDIYNEDVLSNWPNVICWYQTLCKHDISKKDHILRRHCLLAFGALVHRVSLSSEVVRKPKTINSIRQYQQVCKQT